MSKHTPGPWLIQNDGRDTRVVREADGLKSYVASLGEIWLCEEHGGTVGANAALIAAAPELLAALKDAVEQIEASEFPGPTDHMRDIIAQAEGR